MEGALKPGDSLGSYSLLKSLGQGGMAEVFLARHSGVGGFQRLVALKIIHPTHSEDSEFVQSLVEEAKIAVQLNHPNVGQVLDLGLIDFVYFIVMEFIDGKDLHRVLFEASQQNIITPIPVALYVTECIASGLAYCHQRKDHYGRPMNLIHRDVSPQNIFISWNGEVKILDFGIAKASNRINQTEAGIVKGKLQYMSPEQISGVQVDGRSDLFSCGICLYEMLAGEMAYREADPIELLEKIRQARFTPINELRDGLHPEIVNIVERALDVDPNERYADGVAFSNALSMIRRQLYPEFRPVDVGIHLKEIFDDTPFYLDESLSAQGDPLDADDFSESLSSSIIFGPSLTNSLVENGNLPESYQNEAQQEVNFEDSVSQTALIDSIADGAQDNDGSTLGSASLSDKTSILNAVEPNLANPFIDPSTDDHFVGLAPAGQAQISKLEYKREAVISSELDIIASESNDAVEIESKEQAERSRKDYSSNADEAAMSSEINPFDASAAGANSTDDSSRKRPFGWAETVHRKASRRSRLTSTLSGGITLLILIGLASYFGIGVLPSFINNKVPEVQLSLESVPSGADIFLNGKDTKKKTDTTISIPSHSSVIITLTHLGYQPTEFEVDGRKLTPSAAGEPSKKKLVLVPLAQ